MGNLTLSSFLLLLVAISLGSAGQIFIKLGLGKGKIPIVPSLFETFMNIIHAMMNPYVLGGLMCYVVSTLFWLLVVSRVRLSVAYPLISLSYILVVILSSAILHERVDWRFAGAGLLFITVGVSFIGFGLGQIAGK